MHFEILLLYAGERLLPLFLSCYVVGSCACRSWFLINSRWNTGPIKFKLMQKVYIGMIETMSLKILLKGFRENYSDLFKKTTRYATSCRLFQTLHHNESYYSFDPRPVKQGCPNFLPGGPHAVRWTSAGAGCLKKMYSLLHETVATHFSFFFSNPAHGTLHKREKEGVELRPKTLYTHIQLHIYK